MPGCFNKKKNCQAAGHDSDPIQNIRDAQIAVGGPRVRSEKIPPEILQPEAQSHQRRDRNGPSYTEVLFGGPVMCESHPCSTVKRSALTTMREC
jgi:hypothetical protein